MNRLSLVTFREDYPDFLGWQRYLVAPVLASRRKREQTHLEPLEDHAAENEESTYPGGALQTFSLDKTQHIAVRVLAVRSILEISESKNDSQRKRAEPFPRQASALRYKQQ